MESPRQSESRRMDIEYLFEKYSKQIMNLAYTYVKDWGVAEDLTQEIFMKASVKLTAFEQRSSLKTWLYRITINHCKDYRKRRYLTTTFLSAKLHEYLSAPESSVETIAIKKGEQQELAEKIMKLPIKYRETIILYYYEDLTIVEIGRLLKTKEATIKSRLQRGRERLATLLDGGEWLE